MTPIIGHIKSRETVPLSGKESRKEKAQLRARPVWRVAVLASLLCNMVYHYSAESCKFSKSTSYSWDKII